MTKYFQTDFFQRIKVIITITIKIIRIIRTAIIISDASRSKIDMIWIRPAGN